MSCPQIFLDISLQFKTQVLLTAVTELPFNATELTAGTTYYIEFSEVFGTVTAFNAVISRADTVPVTFHANLSKYGEAYFDKDPDITEKTIDIRKGTHLEHYASSGLEVDRDSDFFFIGWSLDPDAVVGDDEILADGPADVYAVYNQIKRVFVDANGGCFHFDPDLTQVVVSFPTSDAFSNQVIIEQHGEPIEGGTDVTGLTKIYAVWKEDRYYLAQGADQSWEKGSSEGLTFTVKRTGDDAMTFSCFRDVKVDGSSVEYPLSKIAEGSLILTLEPEYLESLSVGEHEVRFEFTENAAVETTFTVTEPSVPDEDPDADPDKDPDKDKDDPKGSGNKSSGSDPGKKGSGSKSGGSSAKRSKAAKTADTANAFLWIAIMGASFLGIAHAKRS